MSRAYDLCEIQYACVRVWLCAVKVIDTASAGFVEKNADWQKDLGSGFVFTSFGVQWEVVMDMHASCGSRQAFGP